MPDSRHHDRGNTLTTPSRSERLFSQQNLWYFRTREGDAIGPFRYRSEAENNLDHFVKQLKEKLPQSG